MKLYLAGPMSGIPDHNYPAFHAAAKSLRAAGGGGHDVINPAELNPQNAGLQGITPEPIWRASMRRDLPHLLTCDAVVVLPGWEKSRGARLEVIIAARLGLPILLFDNLQPIAGGRIALIKDLLEFPPPSTVEAP